MADLYDLLGVDPGASMLEIRAAYRDKAKTAHPDAGGDPEAFHALRHALDVLTDPDRRARYDQIGDERDPPRSRHDAEELAPVLHHISEIVLVVLAKEGAHETTTFAAGRFDLMETVRQKVILDFKKAPGAYVGKHEKMIAALSLVRERITCTGEDNQVAKALDQKIDQLKHSIEAAKAQQALGDKILAFLSTYGYKVDQALPSGIHGMEAAGMWGAPVMAGMFFSNT